MPVKIRTISIKAFRGVPASGIELDLDGKGLILRGDNGTGKSSIVDSIEFFFTGHLESLENDQPLSLSKHGPHIGCTIDQVKITLTFTPGPVELSRTFSSAPLPTAALAGYLEVASKGTCILRRAQILEFITSKPAERFRSISDIIGIGRLDRYELTLKHVSDSFTEQLQMTKYALQAQEDIVRQHLECSVSDNIAIISSINHKLRSFNLPEIETLEKLGTHSELLVRSIRARPDRSRPVILNELSSITKTDIEVIPVDELLRLLEQMNALNRQLAGEDNRRLQLLGTFLQVGKTIIGSWNSQTCPLCEQPIDVPELNSNLIKRLATVKALSEKSSELERNVFALRQILRSVREKLQRIIGLSKDFPELTAATSDVDGLVRGLNDVEASIETCRTSNEQIDIEPVRMLFGVAKPLMSVLNTESSALLKEEKLSEKEEAVLAGIQLLQTIDQALNKRRTLLSKSAVENAGSIAAARIYNSFVSTKKQIVQNVFDIIQGDIEKYYKLLHPGDTYKNIKLTITRRASIDLRIDSHGKSDEDPRAFSSEGHLDSLGLCIFLAFVHKFNSDCSLVVLDDVVTTVDGQHRENICELLHNEFANKQFVITTHELLWFKQLYSYFSSVGAQGAYVFNEIQSWDIVSGPVLLPFKPRWQTIQDKLNAQDRSVGNDARIHLENVLKQVCEFLETPIPFRTNAEYVVGDLFPALKKRVDKLITDSQYKANALEAFQKLESTLICGNLLSHDNRIADDLSFAEIRHFCEQVLFLFDTLACPNCKRLIKYYRELNIIRCSKCGFEVKTKA